MIKKSGLLATAYLSLSVTPSATAKGTPSPRRTGATETLSHGTALDAGVRVLIYHVRVFILQHEMMS